MSGHIINLIIIFIIIATLVKRFSEVAKTGRELTDDEKRHQLREPDTAREAVGPDSGRGGQYAEEVSTPLPGPPPSRPPEVRTIEDLWRSFTGEERMERQESPMSQRPEPVPIRTPITEEFADEPVSVSETELSLDERIARIRARREEILRQKEIRPPSHSPSVGIRSLRLGFGGDDLVRGIVMSEILSPPVALRQDQN